METLLQHSPSDKILNNLYGKLWITSISSSYTSKFPIFFDEDNLSAPFLDLWFQLNVFFFNKSILTSTLHLGYCILKFKKKRVMKINKSYQNDKKKIRLTCDLYYDPNIMFCDLDPLWPELAVQGSHCHADKDSLKEADLLHNQKKFCCAP